MPVLGRRLFATPLYGNKIREISFMKKTIILLFSFILVSCNQENPTSPVDELSQSYLGDNNTQRVYETVEWMYEANSNIPYIKIPDSLYSKLSFDTSLSNQGIYNLSYDTEIIIPSEQNHQIKTISENHNLEIELERLAKNLNYQPGKSESIDGSIWIENEKEMFIQFSDSSKYIMLKKPLFIGQEWIREKHSYVNEQGVKESFQQECKVISKENVQVKAGNFNAYKIEVTNHWTDLNSKSIRNYEYYVPNIGMILFESDGNIYRLTAVGNGSTTTIYIRHKVRKELVIFNFSSN
jgi:hypothetical protein